MNIHRFCRVLLLAALLTLNACGTLQVGVEPTAAPPQTQTQYLSLGPADFGCQCNELRISNATIIAPVHVPQGAQLTRVIVYHASVFDVPYSFKVALQRGSGSHQETLAEMMLPDHTYSTTSTVPPYAMRVQSPQTVIDNTHYTYRIGITLTDSSVTLDSGLIVTRVQIEYVLANGAVAVPTPAMGELVPLELPTMGKPSVFPTPGIYRSPVPPGIYLPAVPAYPGPGGTPTASPTATDAATTSVTATPTMVPLDGSITASPTIQPTATVTAYATPTSYAIPTP